MARQTNFHLTFYLAFREMFLHAIDEVVLEVAVKLLLFCKFA